jgi:hypothetical protein
MLRLIYLLLQSWILVQYWKFKTYWSLNWAIYTGRIRNHEGVIDVYEQAKQSIAWKINNQRLDLRIIDTIYSKWKLNYEDEYPTDET